MKKLILSVAIILGSFTTFAQPSEAAKTETTTQTVEEKYKEIKLEDVPSSVVSALKKSQPEAIIEKASVNEKKEYKLEIKDGDQKATVYTDADGKLLKK